MLQFVRKLPVQILIQGALSFRRGFLFHLSAGFAPHEEQIDPLTGMSVNLVSVDRWLGDLKNELETGAFITSADSLYPALAELMAELRQKLSKRAQDEKVYLASLCLEEERGWKCQWNLSQRPAELRLTYSHYIELLPQNGGFDLLRLDLTWCRVLGCEEDFQSVGFRLLKSLRSSSIDELLLELAKHKNQTLDSGSYLESLRLNLLGEECTLTL